VGWWEAGGKSCVRLGRKQNWQRELLPKKNNSLDPLKNVGFFEEDEAAAAAGGQNLLLKLVKPRHTVRQCITSTANHQNPSLTKPDYSTANCSGGPCSLLFPWTTRLRRSLQFPVQ